MSQNLRRWTQHTTINGMIIGSCRDWVTREKAQQYVPLLEGKGTSWKTVGYYMRFLEGLGIYGEKTVWWDPGAMGTPLKQYDNRFLEGMDTPWENIVW
jgi:hypothetical protein